MKMKLQENLQENVKGNDYEHFFTCHNFLVLQDTFEEYRDAQIVMSD